MPPASELLIRRTGNLIDLSPDGISPTPPWVIDLLREPLSYDYKVFLQGLDRYSQDGDMPRNVEVRPRYMYQLQEGRLTTTFGLLGKIASVLQASGVHLRYIDLSPPRQRPGCYTPDWENCRRHIQFRPKQEECLWAMTQRECGVIDAAPGFGKTHVLEAICHLYPRAKIHICIRPKDVASRIVNQLSRSIPNVGQVGGGVDCPGERVTVYTAGSLHLSDGDADFFLGDEAHLLNAESSAAEIGSRYLLSRNFGMTGTPTGRADGTDPRLEMLFGPTIFYLSYQEAVELKLVCPIAVRWLPMAFEHNPASMCESPIHKERLGIWTHDARNAAFAEDAKQYSAQHQVLMLCSKITHAVHLWQHLRDFTLCYATFKPEEIEYCKRHHLLPHGFTPMTATRRDGMRQAFERAELKKVIATDVWSTGVDFPQLQTTYRLDARASGIIATQAPCRASRIYEGKEYGELVDGCDFFDKTLARRAITRRKHYKDSGWENFWPTASRSGMHYG